MIQRIQSLFLFLASGSFFGLFALPFASSDEATKPFFDDRIYNVLDHPALMGVTIAGGAIALLNIFLFKNRGLQMRLTILVIICSIILGVFATYLVYQDAASMAASADLEDGLGVYLPPLALIFGILAYIFVKKDEKLVKSMDRLR